MTLRTYRGKDNPKARKPALTARPMKLEPLAKPEPRGGRRSRRRFRAARWTAV